MRGEVLINPKLYTSMKDLKIQYLKDLKSGFHPQGTTSASIVTHEIGHAIDGYLTNNLMGITIDETFKTTKGKAYLTSSNLRKSVLKNLKLKLADVRSELSGYATNNDREFFAEAFAEYFDSENPRPIAAELGKQLEELFENKRRIK
jgi:hypothetical protein